ncbi:MAG TPA: 3-deoxy-D-manno-octulosonic acid transferase [Gemmataceae bacterium]|nr:3-deoxy-D-manno-octulosonic acid transferase [Gemmataceae bacterium]
MLLDLLYGLAILVLSPWLLLRSIRTGRYRRNSAAKLWGISQVAVPRDGAVAWFHGVSVGEVHLLRQIVRGFRERHPAWCVVVSSTTETGLAEAAKHFPDLTVIPYPFDFSWAVRRTLRAVRPSLIVLAESELWPNFLRAAERARVPVVVVNGRMSPRSARRFARLAKLARRLLFDRVTVFAMQSEAYAANLRSLGVAADRVRVTGSVKYDGVYGEKDNPKTRDLRTLLGIEPTDLVWVAGSTHDPEERIALTAYANLKRQYPALKLVLVPRAPERFDEVAGLIAATGLPFARRSQQNKESRGAAVILIDTLGELGAAWGLATVGFTGGSLNDKRGGQSMIEPAGFGAPVLFGPHTWNFKDAVAGLLDCGGALRVADSAELEREVGRLLADPTLRDRIGSAARAFVQSQQGATKRTLDVLDQVMALPTIR